MGVEILFPCNPKVISIHTQRISSSNLSSKWELELISGRRRMGSGRGLCHQLKQRKGYTYMLGRKRHWPVSLHRVRATANGGSSSSSRENGATGGDGGRSSEEKEKGWVHFVGIGGSGLSALAMHALKQGWKVSGSDITWSNYMDALERAGARLHIGHSSSHLQGKSKQSSLPKAVVVSSAIPTDNEEITFAHSLGIPIYKRDSWIAKITHGYNVVAVSGSHGKSTTAAMLAFVLCSLGDDITAIIGAKVPQFPDGGNAIAGHGPHFVLEADEYDECFLGISPSFAIITNIEWEHVDFFQDEASVQEAFRRFVMQIKPGGVLIACGDSPGSRTLLGALQQDKPVACDFSNESSREWVYFNSGCCIITYGLENNNDWRAVSLMSNTKGGTDYVVLHAGIPMAKVSLQLSGAHNVLNSLAVIASVAALNVGQNKSFDIRYQLRTTQEVVEATCKYLENFTGICRRFEFIGKTDCCDIYDDYAHHPTEVRAVLQAARQRFVHQALWVVFQPHTYSRLAVLLQEFALAFKDADRVIITKVYAAREQNIFNISGRDLASSIIGPSAEYITELEDVLDKLVCEIPSYHGEIIVLTLGAGDVTTLGRRILDSLKVT